MLSLAQTVDVPENLLTQEKNSFFKKGRQRGCICDYPPASHVRILAQKNQTHLSLRSFHSKFCSVFEQLEEDLRNPVYLIKL